MELDKAFIDLVTGPIVSTWVDIGDEVAEVCKKAGTPLDNAFAIGFCIDINASKDEATMSALNAAIAKHSYDEVLSYLARHIRLTSSAR